MISVHIASKKEIKNNSFENQLIENWRKKNARFVLQCNRYEQLFCWSRNHHYGNPGDDIQSRGSCVRENEEVLRAGCTELQCKTSSVFLIGIQYHPFFVFHLVWVFLLNCCNAFEKKYMVNVCQKRKTNDLYLKYITVTDFLQTFLKSLAN